MSCPALAISTPAASLTYNPATRYSVVRVKVFGPAWVWVGAFQLRCSGFRAVELGLFQG
jgi:hypothetical protein